MTIIEHLSARGPKVQPQNGFVPRQRPALSIADQAALIQVVTTIGERITQRATWSGGLCSWPLADIAAGSARVEPPFNTANVYSGASGVALCLADIATIVPNDDLSEAALAGIRYAISQLDAQPPHRGYFGFFDGRMGVGYAAVRVGQQLGENSLVEAGRSIVEDVAMRGGDDSGDVIAGAAGVIPAVLALRDVIGDLAIEFAVRLGQNLVRTARREVTGWSWDCPIHSAVRNFTGYAHGASGMAWALAELYRATGSEEFLYAAQQAIRYENRFFDPARNAWPDPRHPVLIYCDDQGKLDKLGDQLAAGCQMPAVSIPYPNLWCYGSAGMAPVRLLVTSLDSSFDDDTCIPAVESTLVSLGSGGCYSLCHGAVGNADCLLTMVDLLDVRPELRDRAANAVGGFAANIPRWFGQEEKGWRSGGRNGKNDCSLMLGEAGLAHFCLRVLNLATPSITHPKLGQTTNAELQTNWRLSFDYDFADTFFSRARKAFGEFGHDPYATISTSTSSPPVAVDTEITRILAATEGLPEHQALAESSSIERIRYRLLSIDPDHSVDTLRKLLRRSIGDRWENYPLRIAPNVYVLPMPEDGPRVPVEKGRAQLETESAVLLHRSLGDVKIWPLQQLAVLILGALDEPTHVSALLESVDDDSIDPKIVARAKQKLTNLVRWLLDVGVIESVVAPTSQAAVVE